MAHRPSGRSEGATAPGGDRATLRATLSGQLITPGDAGYDAARRVHNGMIDRYPAAIARCRDVADVIAAIALRAGREACRSPSAAAGTTRAGFGTVDDGLVIDLSPMKGIHVDPATRTVRVEAGCTWGDVDHATHAFGLATPSGVVSTTGVGGLTLGRRDRPPLARAMA